MSLAFCGDYWGKVLTALSIKIEKKEEGIFNSAESEGATGHTIPPAENIITIEFLCLRY